MEDRIEVTYSIRVLEGEYENQVEIDGSYRRDHLNVETVLEKVYPAVVDEFETVFEQSQLQYYDESHVE